MSTYLFYPPSQGKSKGSFKTLSDEDCLRFYLRHYRNVLLLERIKGLYHGDFSMCQTLEGEISRGMRKCDYFYKRGSFSGSSLVEKVTVIKSTIMSLDISHFKP